MLVRDSRCVGRVAHGPYVVWLEVMFLGLFSRLSCYIFYFDAYSKSKFNYKSVSLRWHVPDAVYDEEE